MAAQEAKDFLLANLEVVEEVLACVLAAAVAVRTGSHGCSCNDSCPSSLVQRAADIGQEESLVVVALALSIA